MRAFNAIFIPILLCSLLSVTGCRKSPTDPAETTRNSWNSGLSKKTPNIELVEIYGCKEAATGIPLVSASSDQDCIEYWYIEGDVLRLKHVNAGFNCCPVIDVDIQVDGETITIEEIELEGLCYCLCLFDVYYEIHDLVPGTYHLCVIEPYRPENDPVLEFTVDLQASPAGNFCVFRSGYPWGF